MAEQIMEYVRPEFLILAVVLYLLGEALKGMETIANKYIPFILGGVGVVACGICVIAGSTISNAQELATAIFTAFTQGVLVAGLSTYVDQLVKQAGKDE